MIRTMVNLPDELHRSIKHLAVERGTSIAKLVTEALESLYREDVEDLKIGQLRMESYLAQPHKAVAYADFRSKKIRNK